MYNIYAYHVIDIDAIAVKIQDFSTTMKCICIYHYRLATALSCDNILAITDN